MRAREATDENYRLSLTSSAEASPADPDAQTHTFSLGLPVYRGWFRHREGTSLKVQRHDLGNDMPTVAQLDLTIPRRLRSDRKEIYFFDTEPGLTLEDIAVRGGVQALEGSFNAARLARSRELQQLLKVAQDQAKSKPEDNLT